MYLLYFCLNQQFKRANEHRYLNDRFNMRRGKRISYSWHRNRRYCTVYLFCRWKLYSVTTTYSDLPAGSHSINVKDNNGCEFITFISISEIPVPSATINGNVSICSGSSATISVTLTGTSPWSLTYSDGITPVTINNVLSSPYEFIVSPETTTTYLITEVSDGNCSSGNTHGSAVITIASQIIPTFDPIGPLCQGSTSPDLPLNSTNTPPITGTWSPAVISTTADGTYTFTPDPGQCATQTSITITIDDKITPTFTQIGPLCQGSTPPDLPLSSTNTPPITGTWSPAVISTTADDTYTFTPRSGAVCCPGVNNHYNQR